MASYTCLACRVMFAPKSNGGEAEAAELQKAHYKTDWHRYNLKRKVAGLPPVTAENFQERVLVQQEQLSNQEVDPSCVCQPCSKRFSSGNAYENHLKSKKHRDTVARQEQLLPSDVQSKNAKNRELSALDDTAKHLKDKHARNVQLKQQSQAVGMETSSDPQPGTSSGASGSSADTCCDEESETEEWEGDALGVEECLFCPHISNSLEKNVKHMTVEHSFFIPDIEYLTDLEGLIQYLGEKVGQMYMCLWCGDKSRVFTELRSVQQHMVDKGHCKLYHEGDAVLEYSDYYDYRSSYPDHKPGDSGEPMEQSNSDADDDDDAAVSPTELNHSGYQLALPSGATAGHRSLMRYYRQKLKPDRQLVLSKNSSEVSKVIAHYKMLGWTGTTGPAAVAKAKDIAYFQRHQARYWSNVGIKANKLQRHFRDQVFGF